MFDYSSYFPPARRAGRWEIHVPRPIPPTSPRMTDQACLEHARWCWWPIGWSPAEASEVMRRQRPWVRVVLVPEGDQVSGGSQDGDRVLAYLDPGRASVVEDRVHVGGGWYSVGAAHGVPAEAMAVETDLNKVPIQDYRTVFGTLLRVVQDRSIGVASWLGRDDWGEYVEVCILELGRGDPDVSAERPSRPGHRWLLHVAGVALATADGVGCEEVAADRWVRRFQDEGLSAWAAAAHASGDGTRSSCENGGCGGSAACGVVL